VRYAFTRSMCAVRTSLAAVLRAIRSSSRAAYSCAFADAMFELTWKPLNSGTDALSPKLSDRFCGFIWKNAS
jgi:hypothetical protein